MLVQVRAVGDAPVLAVVRRKRPTIKRTLLALRERLVNMDTVDRQSAIALIDSHLERHR